MNMLPRELIQSIGHRLAQSPDPLVARQMVACASKGLHRICQELDLVLAKRQGGCLLRALHFAVVDSPFHIGRGCGSCGNKNPDQVVGHPDLCVGCFTDIVADEVVNDVDDDHNYGARCEACGFIHALAPHNWDTMWGTIKTAAANPSRYGQLCRLALKVLGPKPARLPVEAPTLCRLLGAAKMARRQIDKVNVYF